MMSLKMEQPDPELFCLLGVFLITMGMVISAGTYHGAYFPWNHFVSELGNYQKSSGAVVYNLGLVAGGLALMVPAVRVGDFSRSASRALVIALLCLIFSGLISENVLVLHLILAVLLFVFLGVSVFLVGVAVFHNVHLPCRWRVMSSSMLSITFATLFLFSPKDRLLDIVRGAPMGSRPSFWLLPMMEWSFVISILIWVLSLSSLLRAIEESASDPTHSSGERWEYRA